MMIMIAGDPTYLIAVEGVACSLNGKAGNILVAAIELEEGWELSASGAPTFGCTFELGST